IVIPPKSTAAAPPVVATPAAPASPAPTPVEPAKPAAAPSAPTPATVPTPPKTKPHVAALPDHLKTLDGARQVVVVTAANKDSRDGTLALYDLDSNGNWIKRMSTPTRAGKNALVSGADRHQGSSMTPTGSWAMPSWAFGAASSPPAGAKVGWKQIVSSSYWSSEPGSTYNTWVNHESAGEHLIKYAGQSYKYAINSGYNSLPNTRIEGRGTAIFIHCMHAGYTAGCISIEESKMVELLKKLVPAKRPRCVIGTTDSGTSTSISKY
ncbi:MAG: hypothetical protein WCP28_21935, partial [Actinomycetes bacterium]